MRESVPSVSYSPLPAGVPSLHELFGHHKKETWLMDMISSALPCGGVDLAVRCENKCVQVANRILIVIRVGQADELSGNGAEAKKKFCLFALCKNAEAYFRECFPIGTDRDLNGFGRPERRHANQHDPHRGRFSEINRDGFRKRISVIGRKAVYSIGVPRAVG